MEIAEALIELHEFEPCIVHRDLKPENILITEQGMCVKITDLGLARTLDYIETKSRKTKAEAGTANYMCPESFDKKIVYGVDSWAWALIVNEMWSGAVPFEGKNHM